MRTLENILSLEHFTLMCEKKKDSHSSCPWWDSCVNSVISSIYQDRTTTKANLREKAKNYAKNYLATSTESHYISQDWLIDEIADEVEKELKDSVFDTRPLASAVAQIDRNSVKEDPEEKFIKLGK